MKKLHKTQKRLLTLLERLAGEGYTIRELQDELGLSTPSLVFFHLQQLEKKGYLERNPMNPTDYRLTKPADETGLILLNLYGLASCGPDGTLLSGDPEERVGLPFEFLNVSAGNAFLVRAHGDSMEPRIHEGDVVLFERSNEAPDGSVVACSDRSRAYIKRYVRSGKNVLLYSLNKRYEPFLADRETFRIEGVARLVLGKVN